MSRTRRLLYCEWEIYDLWEGLKNFVNIYIKMLQLVDFYAILINREKIYFLEEYKWKKSGIKSQKKT